MKNIFHNILGQSDKMLRLFNLLTKIAEDDGSTVLIRGESGTGKELVAKAIHLNCPRREKKFVPVNCAAIPDDLLESELFGYTKGSFTGAMSNKKGRIEYADGGTLFLDEIGDMKPSLQAKLLRVLQEREFEPIGALKSTPVDVRVIAATHRNLEAMVEKGQFREDLYYRLNVIPVAIPPLRDRREDITILLDYFIDIFERGKKKRLLGFEPSAMSALISYPWHGNVRELENLVQHMTILHGGRYVKLDDLPEKYRTGSLSRNNIRMNEFSSPETTTLMRENFRNSHRHDSWPDEGIDFNALVNDFEKKLIVRALKVTNGNKKEAARILKLKRTTLLEKIKKKEIEEAWK